MLDSSKLRKFADNNFELDENGRKFFKRVDLWEKEKLLVTCNFSFSSTVFKRLVLQKRKKQSLFGKGLKAFPYSNSETVRPGNVNFLKKYCPGQRRCTIV